MTRGIGACQFHGSFLFMGNPALIDDFLFSYWRRTLTDQQKIHIQLMRNEGLGYLKIANKLSLSVNTVKSFCRRNEKPETTKDATCSPTQIYESMSLCKNCGAALEMRLGHKPRKFCSDACRISWWNSHPDLVRQRAIYHFTCHHCHMPFTSYGNKSRKYCSHSCYADERFEREKAHHDDH